MPYTVISNWGRGIDRRRLIDSGEDGSLWEAANVFINEGGQIEKRLAFDEVSYITTALRHRALSTIVTRGLTPNHIVLLGQFDRDTLFAAGKWPHDNSTTNAAYNLYGNLRFWWVHWDGAGAVQGYPFYAISTAYNGTDMYAAGFLGYDSGGFECYYDAKMPYNAFAGGTTNPGDANGAFAGDATATPRRNPRYYYAHKTKPFWVDGFEVKSGDVAGGASGAGSAEVLVQEGHPGLPLALAPYYSQIVVMGEWGCQFWDMAADWASSAHSRSIDNMPLVASRSVTSYGGGDVLFLSADGIRSLAARDSSNFAKVSDIGAPIDEIITGISRDVAAHAVGGVHVRRGHFWLAICNCIYVLSRSPSANVQAWTRFELPASDGGGRQDYTPHPRDSNYSLSDAILGNYVADMVPAGLDVGIRTYEDRFFVYGGSDGQTYDDSTATVQTPYLNVGRPATRKMFHSIDIACEGTWRIEASWDPYDEAFETIATVSNSTFTKANIPGPLGTSTHLSLRLTTSDASRARIGEMVIHYDVANS